MIGFYPGKVNYIVDRRSFDMVIDQGFRVTKLIRCTPLGLPEVDYAHYKNVKRILSDLLHKKKFLIKVSPFSSQANWEVWGVDIYELPEGMEDYDVSRSGLLPLKHLNPIIIKLVEEEIKNG